VEESPLLKELYGQYKDRGVSVVGVSLDEELKPVQEMVANYRAFRDRTAARFVKP